MANNDNLDIVKNTLSTKLEKKEVDVVIKTEMTLALLEYFAPNEDAEKAYLLLHSYAPIGNIAEKEETYLLQKAHIYLRNCSSKQNWKELLKKYREDIPENLRFYKLSDEIFDGKTICKLSRNEKVECVTDRFDIYIEHIKQYSVKHNVQFAKAEKYKYRNENGIVFVTIPKHKTNLPHIPEAKSKRPDIKVTISELLQSAKEMQKLNPGDHCFDVLNKNIIKAVKDGHVVKAEELSIHEVVNMVGMVGAGKSTLMNVLAYHLSKQGKKIVIVLETVADTLHKYSYFYNLNVNVSPLIGRSGREKYIKQVAEQGEKFIKPEYSKYLTTPCIIGGMARSDYKAAFYGKEPCKELIKDDKDDKDKKKKIKYICPFVDVCPGTRMYRDILSSNVIITTIQGLAAIHLLGYNRLFLEYVIEQADLVIFDECDKVQKTLDEYFTPSTKFTKFMNESADDCASDMKKDAGKIDDMGENEKIYSELRNSSLAMYFRIRDTIEATTGSWRKMLRNTFSSLTLYKQLCKDSEKGKHPLTPYVIEELEKAMDEPMDDELKDILVYVKYRENESKFRDMLKKWLEKNGCKYDDELLQHIKLYLIVIQFENYVLSLEFWYDNLPEEQKTNMELFNYLQSRFTAQQKILPSAVMGNLLGMRNDEKNGPLLYKQYAFGRAMMTGMPWLRLTETGEPAGPHVLLLSGSSWAKGCLEYHVHAPVRYLIEAEEWIRKKLSETEIIDLETGIRVSGGGQENRISNLEKVIDKCMDPIEAELNENSKILMIVNSYDEAERARPHLESKLREMDSNLSDTEVAVLTRTTDENDTENDNEVPREEVSDFYMHKAKILIAPAQSIERGYNIVDEKGQSIFGSVFFLVRPMAVPNEISSKCAKLNGIIEERFFSEKYTDAFKKANEIRQYATMQWKFMEEESKKSLASLKDPIRKDVIASLFILILQIFGRLARITDENKPAPRIYFADGAFRANPKSSLKFDCLNELYDYLEKMMSDEESGEIAKTLYEPFYEAYKRGVKKNVYNDKPDEGENEEYPDISYGDETEDEYNF